MLINMYYNREQLVIRVTKIQIELVVMAEAKV